MPTLTVREYHPESGAMLENISVLGYGKLTQSMHSSVRVIDIAFGEVTSIGNIKIGLVSSGGLSVTRDGTSANGYFGIEDTASFDASKAASTLTTHFTGINTTLTAADAHNVSVGNRSNVLSNYIYLDIELPSSLTSSVNGAYQVFFDYS